MEKLKTMQARVEFCLETYPICRDDDNMLIGAIYSIFYDVDVKHITFKEILLRNDLPSFETIRRCRQKAQEQRPELRGTRYAQKKRRDNEKRVKEYVKGA